MLKIIQLGFLYGTCVELRSTKFKFSRLFLFAFALQLCCFVF